MYSSHVIHRWILCDKYACNRRLKLDPLRMTFDYIFVMATTQPPHTYIHTYHTTTWSRSIQNATS
jgi:hypothetical protein